MGSFFAEGKLDVINEESSIEYVICSAMVVRFDTVMLPPLRKSYRLHIPAGSPVAIYTLEGKAIANLTADGSILHPAPAAPRSIHRDRQRQGV